MASGLCLARRRPLTRRAYQLSPAAEESRSARVRCKRSEYSERHLTARPHLTRAGPCCLRGPAGLGPPWGCRPLSNPFFRSPQRPMPTPFSSDDLGRVFDARTLTKGRSLVLLGAVEVSLAEGAIMAEVEHAGFRRTATVRPSALG